MDVTLKPQDLLTTLALTLPRVVPPMRDGRRVSLANGPRIVEGKAHLTSLAHRPDGDGYVVEAAYDDLQAHR